MANKYDGKGRPLTQDAKEAHKQELEAAQKKARESYDRLKRQAADVASTESGIAFLQALMAECGFHEPTLQVRQNGEIVADTVLEAKRTVWLKVRKLIPHQFLVQIENPAAPKRDVAKAMEKL